MRKLAEVQDEKALDLLADILEPTVEICSDPELKKMVGDKSTKIGIVKYIIKNHKRSIMEILAAMDGVPVEEYHCNVLTLPATLLELINDPEVSRLFTLQDQMTEKTSSGPAMESTTEPEQ